MSKKKTLPTLPEQFKAAEGDLRRQWQLAAPIAKRSLWNQGLDAEDYLLENVAMLAGNQAPFHTKLVDAPEHDLWFAFCDAVQAAFVLGITVGQCVPADAFTAKGAK